VPKINIDELCEPIEVTVGGKVYTIDDISRDVAQKMEAINAKPDEGKSTGANLGAMAELMAEILGADQADMAKLGMRKLTRLIVGVMSIINEELEGKNVPKVVVAKKP